MTTSTNDFYEGDFTVQLVRCHADGRLRRLTPEELEALSDFPRGFLVGNVVVTGVIALQSANESANLSAKEHAKMALYARIVLFITMFYYKSSEISISAK